MEKTLVNVSGANVQNWVFYLQFLTDVHPTTLPLFVVSCFIPEKHVKFN